MDKIELTVVKNGSRVDRSYMIESCNCVDWDSNVLEMLESIDESLDTTIFDSPFMMDTLECRKKRSVGQDFIDENIDTVFNVMTRDGYLEGILDDEIPDTIDGYIADSDLDELCDKIKDYKDDE